MVENFEPIREPQGMDRLAWNWKAVVAAWALVVVVALVLIAGHVFRAPPADPEIVQTPAQLGAVIPRHDPVCAGAELPSAARPEACGPTPAPIEPGYPDW
jgi:hypothetical protein